MNINVSKGFQKGFKRVRSRQEMFLRFVSIRFFVSREMLKDLSAEEAAIQVRVDFRGGDSLVSQHGLNGAQVCAPFQQVGGKGVAERVRRNVLCDACRFGSDAQVVEHGDAGKMFASSKT